MRPVRKNTSQNDFSCLPGAKPNVHMHIMKGVSPNHECPVTHNEMHISYLDTRNRVDMSEPTFGKGVSSTTYISTTPVLLQTNPARHQHQHQHHQYQRPQQAPLAPAPSAPAPPAPTPAPAPAPAPLAPAPSAPAPPAPPKCRFYYSFVRSTRTILRKGCAQHHQNVDFTTVSYDLHAQFYERVAPSTARSQFYHSFVRSTRTILRKGRSVNSKMSILLQFRAIDTYDLMKGFIGLRQDRNFTTVSRDRHVRSYERVHRAPTRSQFYYSFARSTRTILREGSSGSGKIAILLQFRAIDTHDLTRGFIGLRQDRNFTTVSRDRHARSYERVAFPQAFSGPWRPPPPLLK